jgi:uncharacterized protein YgiM (DUF1202 family)
MKSNFWLFGGLAWLAAASALAQTAARDSNAPVVSRLLTGPLAKDVLLDPPATATVKIESLLVRTQPAFAGDILTHVVKGQSLTVLEQIALAKPKLNEPTNWARIVLPSATPVWVFADYVNTNSMTITARRVNVRGGPGDYYGIVALLDKGARVKQVRRTIDWIQIEPPTNAYGFVASDYLTIQPPPAPPPAIEVVSVPAPSVPSVLAVPAPAPPPEPAAPMATLATNETIATQETTNTTPAAVAAAPIVPPEPVAPTAPETVAVPPPEPIAPAPPEPVAPAPPEPVAPAPPAITTPAPAPSVAPAPAPPAAPAPELVSIDAKPRVVTREGYVLKALNLQAPSDFELRDVSSKTVTEFLQPDSQDKAFNKFVGARVFVTGTEWLDPRWPKTPILRIQTVDIAPP